MEIKSVIFEKDKSTLDIIKNYLSELDNVVIDRVFDDYNEGMRYIKENQPRIVLFSMTTDKPLCHKMITRLAEFGVNIIVLSEDFTTSNIIQTLRCGAKDFISKPIIKKELINSINKCSKNDVKVLKKSQIITVFSNKGGIGKTAISTNLAIELSKLTRDKVALVDLNLPIGDITTFLDIKPTVHISELLNGTNPKPKFIQDACCRYKDTDLYILAEPAYVGKPDLLNPNKIEKLFDYLRDTFSYVIVDMGSSIDKLNLSILDNSDLIFLTTVVNLPLIRNCQRCLDLFKNLQYPEEKIKILINRYLENDEITISDIEKTLSKPVYWKIPNNYFTMMSSINKGIPVSEINENSNITESFTGLASKITDDMFEKDLS